TTAEETAKRLVGDAQREAESLRKTAVLTGKEELIRLREEWELEVRGRREEVERENAGLTTRLDAARARTQQMIDRVRFLRQQHDGAVVR
ncbi:MAG: ribonucrease, partial [Gemmatimonadaceae bacterium]|nr:ribonucrease [Gemmatimonadaceae bacterium]